MTTDADNVVSPEPPASTRPGASRPALVVGLLTTALVVIGVALLAATPDRAAALRRETWWVFALVVVLYALFEYKVFNVEFDKEGIVYTLTEVPLAIGLVFLSPTVAVVARLLGSVPILAIARRNRGLKLAFNSALYLFDVTLAFFVHRWLIDGWGDGDTGVLAAVVVALVLTPLITSVIITLAIAAYEGDVRQRIGAELAASWWLHPVGSVVPVMMLAVVFVEPVFAPIAAVPIAGMWYVLNSFGRQRQALRDLDTLYGFAGRIGQSLDADEIVESAADELSEHVRNAGLAIVRFTETGNVVTRRGEVAVALPDRVDDPWWTSLIDEHAQGVVPADALLPVWCGAGAPAAALVASLRDGDEVVGMMIALHRQLLGSEWVTADALRFQSIAEQLAVSLRRGLLHERLEFEARHDALTGLPGRRLFERAAADAIAARRPGVWVVMMLDLDRFKEVNDTLGHHAGDALLIEFSRRMSSLLGPDDMLARLYGDEFAILCRRDDREQVVALADECAHIGGRAVVLDGLEVVVTVSVGVAELTEIDSDPLEPMRRADIAMYNAKWQRTGVELYRDEIDRRTPARLSMLGDLRSAIERDELDVVYQPKLDVRTGVVTGVEALVRWEHDTRGLVAPTDFIRVAEDTGLIKDLTDLVLARGIAALRVFEQHALGVGLAVNLSTHDLFDAALPGRVSGYLSANGVPCDLLTLEITESSLLVDAPRTRGTIDELHGVGLRLAIDDFGTGYSSLSYLRRLPVQELKIDQSFVSRVLTDPQDEVIVRSTIDLGHNLGLRVVAEGVETDEILGRLAEFGCDVAQGYAIAEPMSAETFIGWLDRRRADGDGATSTTAPDAV